MSEVTRVPLQPIEKGSVLKIWLGVLVALLIGIGTAWAFHPRGVDVETLQAGSGAAPKKGDVAIINYVGRFADGKEFDRGDSQPIPLDAEMGIIPGFVQGLEQMKAGGKYRLEIPAALGYGAKEQTNPQTGKVVIPANSDLVFEVEVVRFMTMQDFQMLRMMQMQQLQQMQGGAGGPGGAGPMGPPEAAHP